MRRSDVGRHGAKALVKNREVFVATTACCAVESQQFMTSLVAQAGIRPVNSSGPDVPLRRREARECDQIARSFAHRKNTGLFSSCHQPLEVSAGIVTN
jgi:hypothetical protein